MTTTQQRFEFGNGIQADVLANALRGSSAMLLARSGDTIGAHAIHRPDGAGLQDPPSDIEDSVLFSTGLRFVPGGISLIGFTPTGTNGFEACLDAFDGELIRQFGDTEDTILQHFFTAPTRLITRRQIRAYATVDGSRKQIFKNERITCGDIEQQDDDLNAACIAISDGRSRHRLLKVNPITGRTIEAAGFASAIKHVKISPNGFVYVTLTDGTLRICGFYRNRVDFNRVGSIHHVRKVVLLKGQQLAILGSGRHLLRILSYGSHIKRISLEIPGCMSEENTVALGFSGCHPVIVDRSTGVTAFLPPISDIVPLNCHSN